MHQINEFSKTQQRNSSTGSAWTMWVTVIAIMATNVCLFARAIH